MYKERVAEEQLSGRRRFQVVGGQAVDEGLATGRGRLKSMYVGGISKLWWHDCSFVICGVK